MAVRLYLGIIKCQESDAETPRLFSSPSMSIHKQLLQKNRGKAAVVQADTTLHAPLQSQDTGAASLQFGRPRDDRHAVSHVT